ncbi:MAG: hypothetical protein JSR76_05435 [Verrucomicrobia bacterium]|nr:hypothetical protein [Verrucomicrobiota bacterium]
MTAINTPVYNALMSKISPTSVNPHTIIHVNEGKEITLKVASLWERFVHALIGVFVGSSDKDALQLVEIEILLHALEGEARGIRKVPLEKRQKAVHAIRSVVRATMAYRNIESTCRQILERQLDAFISKVGLIEADFQASKQGETFLSYE